jgi:hypothetical protein
MQYEEANKDRHTFHPIKMSFKCLTVGWSEIQIGIHTMAKTMQEGLKGSKRLQRKKERRRVEE